MSCAGALFSAGHTGATLVAAHATFGMVPSVDRPALATTIPTRLGSAVLLDAGVSYAAHWPSEEGPTDFFASDDPWCRPVMARVGPDGALWVADMYRAMIEHPDWFPPEGRAEMLPKERLGDDRGRNWRVVRADAPPARFPASVTAARTPEAVEIGRAHV